MNLNENKGLTLAGIGGALVVITTVALNLTGVLDWFGFSPNKEPSKTTQVVEIAQEISPVENDEVSNAENKIPETVLQEATPESKAVKLTDMDFFNASDSDGGFLLKDSRADNLGNIYAPVLAAREYGSLIYNQYYINKQYDTFSGTVFLLADDKTTTRTSSFEIYGDDCLLYSYTFAAGVLPQTFDVSVTDVEILEIRLVCENVYLAHTGVADAVLDCY